MVFSLNVGSENEKSRDTDRNDVSRLHTVPEGVSGSETSFRMSHEIVPVSPAQMSHHIDPAENPEAKAAQTRRKAMSRDIDPLWLSAPKWGILRLCLCEAQAGAASAFRSSSRCVSHTTNGSCGLNQVPVIVLKSRKRGTILARTAACPSEYSGRCGSPISGVLGHLKTKNLETPTGTMSRDFTLCPRGDLNPHVR